MKYKLGDIVKETFTGYCGYIVSEEDEEYGEVEVCWFNPRITNNILPAYTTWTSIKYIKKVQHDKP